MSILKSFHVAIRGIILVWREERSFQIQTAVAALVIFLMLIAPLKSWERIILLLIIALVLILEILNTIVERFVDMVKPRLNSYVGVIKDMMAGAVLVMSFVAAIIGLIIFIPHLQNTF